MLCIKIENGLITQVVNSEKLPAGFVRVPDNFTFVSSDVRYYNSEWAPKSEELLVEEGVIAPERTVYSTETGMPITVREFEVPEGYTLKAPEPGQVWDGDAWFTPEPEPLTIEQVHALRRAAYAAESDPLKIEAEHDAIKAGTEPDYTAWLAAVATIKARYPLPPEAA